MPDSPVVYEDAEVLEHDDLGFVCRIGNERAFIGKYVPLADTNVRRQGDRGRLVLPRWFVEQQRLPLDRHLNDREVEEWFALLRLRAATAKKHAEAHPDDPEARAALDRVTNELEAARLLRARRLGEPR
jgi:ribosomal protein S15P/S13E